MESILLLPVVLLSFMAAAQFAHIYFARYMIEYAAYSGARAGRLGSAAAIQTNAYNAAGQVCSVLALTSAGTLAGDPLTLPWLGTIEGSQSLAEKLQVTCTEEPGKSITCTVRMDFPLVVPVVREVVAGLVRFTEVGSRKMLSLPEHPASDTVVYPGDSFPHLRFKRSATVPRNYRIAD